MEKQYVHITGFSRSGTTLLGNLFRCYNDVFVALEETPRLGLDERLKGNAKIMVTRRPTDALDVDVLSRLLEKRDTHVVYMIRDPRDCLVSVNKFSYRAALDTGPFYNPSVLVKKMKILPQFKDGVDLIKYERLVTYPMELQEYFATLLNLTSHCDFLEGHKIFPSEEESAQQKAMGGIRPIDTEGIGRGQAPRHRNKVNEVLNDCPILVEFMEEYGYG